MQVNRIFGNMERLEKYYYSGAGLLEGPSQAPAIFANLLQKQAPHLIGTAGLWQAIFGRRVWGQLNYETNAFAILAKRPWDRSGWRVKTAKAASSGGGIAETDTTLPVTVKGTYATVSTKPKIHGNTWESSELLNLLSEVDDAVDILAVGREDAGLTHRDLMNLALCKEFGTLPTPARPELESIDRMCASTAERVACGENDGDEDPWGTAVLDRSGNAWADSNVLHKSNVDRPLSLGLIDQLYRTIATASGETPKVILTGFDTVFTWGALLQSQQRYFGEMTVQPTFEGIRAATPGIDGAFNVSAYFGTPIIPSKDIATDTIGRIYMLNPDYLWLKVAKPTRYFETSDPFVLNALATRGLYETVSELICTFFKAQGKIRDLK